VAIKETGLEGNADNTKYMVMSWDQNAGWSHRIKTDNSSFEKVAQIFGKNNNELNLVSGRN
jgi:hypothetical protein